MPLSFAVMIVLASSFAADEFVAVGARRRAGRVLRASAPPNEPMGRVRVLIDRLVVARRDLARRIAVRRRTRSTTARRSRPCSCALVAAAVAQVLADIAARGSSRARAWRSHESRPPGVAGDRVVGDADGDRLPRRRRRRRVRHLGAVALLHAAARGLVRLRAARLRHVGVPPDDRGARDGARARRARAARARGAGRGAAVGDGRPSSVCRPRHSTTWRWPRCLHHLGQVTLDEPEVAGPPEPHHGRRGDEQRCCARSARSPARATSSPVTVDDARPPARGAGAPARERVRRPDRVRRRAADRRVRDVADRAARTSTTSVLECARALGRRQHQRRR